MTRTERRERLTISLVISLFVFAALFIATVIVGAAVLILLHYDLLQVAASSAEGLTLFVILLMLTSLVVGGVVSWLVIRMPLGPVNKLINGLPDGSFGADVAVTRESVAQILYTYAQYMGLDTTADNTALNQFTDQAQLGSWAADAMSWAVSAGVTSGRTTFSGGGTMVKASSLRPAGQGVPSAGQGVPLSSMTTTSFSLPKEARA